MAHPIAQGHNKGVGNYVLDAVVDVWRQVPTNTHTHPNVPAF